YSKKDISSVKEVTDILAIEDAKKKAITLAKGFNVKLSKPCRIRYESDADLRPLRAVSLRSSNDSSSDISIYTPEKITVSSEVYVEYSIDD
ncbi:MAG: SIMPL domain-containing protein, partial [Succinivibrio sp.]